MKLLLASLVCAFVFLVAPSVPGLRSSHACGVPKLSPSAPLTMPKLPFPGLLDDDDDKEDDSPAVVCTPGKRCVPEFRIYKEIDEKQSKDFIAWVKAANEAGAKELLVEMNTPGGSVDAGFEMARAIENSDAPVTCVVDGDADSMGFYILQSCEKRMMTGRSKAMTHEPAAGGMFFGRPNEWQSRADSLAATRAQFEWQAQHRLKVSMKEYQERTRGGKMWFMLPDEALKVGAIDKIVDTMKSVRSQLLNKK